MGPFASFDARWYAWASGSVFVLLLAIAWALRLEAFWSGVLVNVSTTFLGFALGLVVLNVYMHRRSQATAVEAILNWVYPALKDRHNMLRTDVWAEMGEEDYTKLLHDFAKFELDARRLRPDQRGHILRVAVPNHEAYRASLLRVDETLEELQKILGWSFDQALLSTISNARCELRTFKALDLAKKDNEAEVCGVTLRVDIQCTNVVQGLYGILGYELDNAKQLPELPLLQEKRKSPWGRWAR